MSINTNVCSYYFAPGFLCFVILNKKKGIFVYVFRMQDESEICKFWERNGKNLKYRKRARISGKS